MTDIHRAIGMGSEQMLDKLLPADRDRDADADEVVFTGDTVWDVRACQKAGVPCIGLLSGGISRDELTAAGAAEVYPARLTCSRRYPAPC